MDLKVIEPIKTYLKEFETPDEFNLYYAKNKTDFDSQTTHKLNKLYHIKGYRITKIKNVLMLKKWDDEHHSKENINDKIEEINNEISSMKDAINKIIQYLNHGENISVSPPSDN
ncbi:hypothetical protein M9Y10_044500 [Tritrichomonas musculus]|uniref:Uncharacterized protein n=1 Tax=Tritrichomonas musculus TaxID=1915356 RepID=A0ABR2JSI7_9EUKA